MRDNEIKVGDEVRVTGETLEGDTNFRDIIGTVIAVYADPPVTVKVQLSRGYWPAAAYFLPSELAAWPLQIDRVDAMAYEANVRAEPWNER